LSDGIVATLRGARCEPVGVPTANGNRCQGLALGHGGQVGAAGTQEQKGEAFEHVYHHTICHSGPSRLDGLMYGTPSLETMAGRARQTDRTTRLQRLAYIVDVTRLAAPAHRVLHGSHHDEP
jgi:hypothetical protein